MVYKPEVQCDYKLFLADFIEVGKNNTVSIYLLKNKKSIKQYCRDTGTPFKDILSKDW